MQPFKSHAQMYVLGRSEVIAVRLLSEGFHLLLVRFVSEVILAVQVLDERSDLLYHVIK